MGGMNVKGTPMLFPMEATVFWKELRAIVREEVKGNLRGGTAVVFETPGLTYKPLFKMQEVCSLFGVTRPTIYDWVKHGKLRPYKIRSRVYFLWEDVERLVKGGV